MGKFLISLGAAGIASTLIVLALPQEIFAEGKQTASVARKPVAAQAPQAQPKVITLPPLQGPF